MGNYISDILWKRIKKPEAVSLTPEQLAAIALQVGGTPGPKGDKGDPGNTGLQGLRGNDGAQGVKGDTGSQGIQGVKGDKGDPGNPGQNGSDATVTKSAVESVLTGEISTHSHASSGGLTQSQIRRRIC